MTKDRNGYHKKEYLIQAESEEKAKMQIPALEEILSVKRLDGEIE